MDEFGFNLMFLDESQVGGAVMNSGDEIGLCLF